MAAQTILTPGQTYGAFGSPGFPTDVFITGTAAGAEVVTIGDLTTAGFSNNFAAAGVTDTIRLAGLAANFTIAVSGNQVSLVSVTDGITVTLPAGFTGTTIVFETSPGVFGDSRTLKFFADGGDADLAPDLFLGNQQITPDVPATGVTPGGNPQNNIVLTLGQDVITAGAADDTFFGFNSTLNAGDNLDGGLGTNTLKVSVDGNATNNAYSGFTTTNIQNLIVTSDDQNPTGGQAVTLDLSGATGLTKVVSQNSSQDLSFNQLTNIVDVVLDTVTNPNAGGPDVTVEFQNAVVAGANDTVNLAVKTSFADVVTVGSVGNPNGGVENIAVSVTGGASELDTLNSDITGLTITGDANQVFKIDQALNNTVRTIDANTLLGTLDIDFSANDAGGQGVTFTGARGANTVLGGNAGDSITTFAGSDVITTADDLTATGDDTVDAGEGNNTVTSADGDDSITTGAGNDVIAANDGNNTVVGGAGNNLVTSGTGNDVVTTLGGADTISSGDGNDLLDSGAGADLITIGVGQHTISSGLGNDTVVAGSNFDARTLGGPDVQDAIDFGDEAGDADELRINSGINGGAGADDFFTNITDDSLEILTVTSSGIVDVTGGGDGVNDAQASGFGIVNLDFGGTHTNTFTSTSFTRGLVVNVGGGDDTISLGSGDDTINAPGNGNLTNADRWNGGLGTGDVLNLDGDTTIDNTAVGGAIFNGIEFLNLDKNDSGADNDYGLTLNDLNAPTNSGTLTVNGAGLAAGETVTLTTAAVTGAGFNVSVTSGSGNDVLTSGVKNDTMVSGAGNDAVSIALGGNDLVRTEADSDTITANGGLTGADTIFGGGQDAGTQTTDVFGAGFTNGDTLIVTGANAAPAFVNVFEVETIRSDGAGSSVGLDGTSSTDIKQVILNDAGAQTLSAAAFAGSLIVDASAGGNDAVTVGGGNDTVLAGIGDQKFVLGAGDDTVSITGTEFNTADSAAGGAGNDTIQFDNRNGAVTAAVDLNIVTDIENYNFLANGDRLVGVDADASQVSFTSLGNVATVGTLTNINVSSATLTDGSDSLRVLLTAGLADRDFQFTVTGSGAATTVVEKDNLGVTNNIIFNATGAGRDDLIIDGDDAGSTVSMSGGGGQDRIVQSQLGGARSMLSDDGFVNITNVNILTGEGAVFGPDGDLNATLGQRAAATGINQIIDTAGDDDVLLNAAFTNNLSVSVSGGDDVINGGAVSATLSFVANGAAGGTVTATDALTGGTGLLDTLTLRNNETANISGVDAVEAINFTNNALTNQTATVTTDGSNVLSAGQTLLNINAGTLNDAGDSLVFTATGGALGYSVTGAAGNDSVTTQGAADIINTGSGNDTVNAGNGNNVIDTSTGNDSVVTGSGNDSITLGTGNDTVFAAGAGNDTVLAGDGNDQIRTDAGADSIVAGAGADQVFGGAGGDTIAFGGSDGALDTSFYVALGDSSTSSARDTITGFTSGEDVIDVRYVAELLTNVYAIDPDGAGPLAVGQKVYTAGTSQLQFLGNFSEFGGAQGALSNAQAGNVGIVFQQNTNTLWVDLNDDSVLNGDDLQIVLDGITTVQAADVLSGFAVGQTNVPSGASVVGTIIDERFVLQGAGPWTVDGGLGSDTIVASNGQDISTVRAGPSAGASFTNAEFLEIAAGGTVFTDVAQYNVFRAQETAGTGGFVNTGAGQTLSFTDSGVIDGTTGTGVDSYILGGGNDDFELGNSATNVALGGGTNTFRTQPAGAGQNGPSDVDVITGTLTLTGNDTWEADSNDDISGATIVGAFDQTNLNESTITVTAAQHGTTGNNGLLGTIIDQGDDTAGGNTTDTINIVDAATITGHADIENYNLSTGNDVFTVNAAKLGVNLISSAGADRVVLTGTVPTADYVVEPIFQVFSQGDYNFGGNDDTLQIVGSADIRAVNDGAATTLETLDLATTGGANDVALTEAQHDAFGAANITGAGGDDTVNLFSLEPFNDPSANAGDDGVVVGSGTIGTYNLDGSFDFKVGVGTQAVNSTNGTQTIRVDGLVQTGNITDDTGGDGDVLVLSNGGDVTGSTLTNIEGLRVDTSGTLGSGQYAAFGEANVTGTSGADALTVVSDGLTTTITGDTDIETFNLQGDLTFNVVGLTTDVAGRSTQDVNGDGGDQTVVITNLDFRGDIALGGQAATDSLSLVGDAVGGAGTADISQAGSITGVEATTVSGQTKMTLAQHNGTIGAISGEMGTDQITVVGAGTLTGQTAVENYVLDNGGANTFNVVADTRSVIVAASGSLVGFNDTINLDGATFTNQPFTLKLDANAGGLGDLLTTTGTIDISNINAGAETTAETLQIVTDAVTTSMTVEQHEGFTAMIDANGAADTVALTNAGTVNAEIEIETYNLDAASNTVVVSGLATGVNITSTGGTDDTVNIAGLTVTGNYTLDGTNDVLIATTGANIAGVNGGAATTLETLNLTGAISMTEAQHDGFGVAINAAGGADQITLTSANENTKVSGDADIETYVLGQTDNAFTFTLGSLTQNVTDGSNKDNTVIFGAGAYTSSLLGFAATDVYQVVDGTNIAGVGGAVVGVNLDFQDLAGTVTMLQSQHETFGAFVNTANAQNVVINGGGAVTGKLGIEAYNLSDATNTLTVDAGQLDVDVTSTGATNDTIVIGGNTVTGDYALDGAGDQITATDGANIAGVNSGAATTAETLNLTGGITMTVAQHNGFTVAITAAGGADKITLTDSGTLTGAAAIETYVLFTGDDTFTYGANLTQDVSSTAGIDTLVLGTGLTVGAGAEWTFDGADDVLTAATGTHIANVNAGAATTLETLNLTGSIIMTDAQYDAFTAINAAGASDAVSILGLGSIIAADAVESFNLNDAGNDSITFQGADAIRGGQTLSIAGGGTNQITLVNSDGFTAGGANELTVNGFVGNVDDIVLTGYSGTFVNDATIALDSTSLTGNADGFVVEFAQGAAVTLSSVANAGEVETLIADAVTVVDNGTTSFFTVVYDGSGNAGLYQVNVAAGGSTNLTVSEFSLEYLGAFNGVGANAFTANNFA